MSQAPSPLVHVGVSAVARLVLLSLAVAGCNPRPVVEEVTPGSGPESGGEITVTGRNFRRNSRITVDGAPIAGTRFVDKHTLHADLPPGQPTLTVRIGVLNPPDRAAETTFPFEYRDTTPPYIVGMAPAGVYTDAAPLVRVEVSFSEPLAAGDIALVDDRGRPIPGTTSVADTVLVFAPARPLAAGRDYTVHLNRVQDAAGNVMAPLPFQFTVAKAPR
jgi:hypothetical protein